MENHRSELKQGPPVLRAIVVLCAMEKATTGHDIARDEKRMLLIGFVKSMGSSAERRPLSL